MANKKVTKSDLIDKIYEKTNLSKKYIQIVTDALLDQIKKSIEEKSTIELRGFGTFEVSYRKSRNNARNPKTGEKVVAKSKYVTKFIPGKDIKEALKNDTDE